MTTSALHLELLLAGRVSAPATARPIRQAIAVRESLTLREPNVMNPFARGSLGVPLSRFDRVGILVIFTGIALVLVRVLVG